MDSFTLCAFPKQYRKIYCQDMDPAGFIDPAIQNNYPGNDYHRIYLGEILTAFVGE